LRPELEGLRINASRGGDWECSPEQAQLVAWLTGIAVRDALAESGIFLRYTRAETGMVRDLRLEFLARVFERDIDSSLALQAGEANATLDLLDTHGRLVVGRWMITEED